MENKTNILDNFHNKTKHLYTLFQFIKTNKEEQFLEYISNLTSEEIDVNMRDEHGNYLVTFAVMMNRNHILKKLIEYGSRLDIIDVDGYTILYYPIKYNYVTIIDTLLEYNNKIIGISLVNLKDRRDNVPIFYAIKYKNRYALQVLLSYGADANYKGNENISTLHLAVLKKDLVTVKMIFKYIRNIDSTTNQGSTALHYACNFQLAEIVKFLLEGGANQNIAEYEYDFYPIFYAVVQNNVEISKMLIDYGANPNYQDYQGNTIIHYAIINGNMEILDYIMEKYTIADQNINLYSEDINDKKNVPNNIIFPNIANLEGLTIVHLMLYQYNDQYDKYLRLVLPFSNLNSQDNRGNTILHIIVEKNLWKNYSNILSTKKLDIYIKNNAGKTVMDMVNVNERNAFVKLVTKSYYNYLKKYEKGWLLEWQNECSNKKLSKIDKKTCFDIIRKVILNEKISVPLKKNKKSIVIVNEELLQISTFTGSILDLVVGFKYLSKKYPNATSLFHSHHESDKELREYYQSLGIIENLNQHLIHFEIRWIYQKLFLPPSFESTLENIIRNKKHKYIIIPIGIILSNGNHSNGLFYDIEKGLMERFEPHGSSYPNHFNYNPDLLDEILYKKFVNVLSNIYGRNVQIIYYQPKKYLPKIGFQTFENTEININKNIGDPNGFCTLWTIWYLDYRLKYVDTRPDKLVRKLIEQIRINNYSFRTIIRNYSRNIIDLRDMYLSKINRHINDYLNNRLSHEELKRLILIILSDT
jgi:ankyrin repeat protein